MIIIFKVYVLRVLLLFSSCILGLIVISFYCEFCCRMTLHDLRWNAELGSGTDLSQTIDKHINQVEPFLSSTISPASILPDKDIRTSTYSSMIQRHFIAKANKASRYRTICQDQRGRNGVVMIRIRVVLSPPSLVPVGRFCLLQQSVRHSTQQRAPTARQCASYTA